MFPPLPFSAISGMKRKAEKEKKEREKAMAKAAEEQEQEELDDAENEYDQEQGEEEYDLEACDEEEWWFLHTDNTFFLTCAKRACYIKWFDMLRLATHGFCTSKCVHWGPVWTRENLDVPRTKKAPYCTASWALVGNGKHVVPPADFQRFV